MSAELICVGSELLLGDILNTNAQYIAQELAKLGIPHYYQTVVGDNPERLQAAIDIAIHRAEILIFTGGLGPTPDDLTVETLADFFHVPLQERPDVLKDIEAKYAQRGRIMSPSNRKQALLPEGADVLPNPVGSAPGIIWRQGNVTIFTFPGVPSEMRAMWQETAVPALKALGWGQQVFHSRTLKFWGIPESELAEKVSGFLNSVNPTVAPYANYGHVKLRVSARAESTEAAEALIHPIAQQIQEIAGQYYYGCDEETLATVVGQQLQEQGETLAVAESCTGGYLGKALTEVPGSSAYFSGGVIAYENRIKKHLLGVDGQMLETLGAVSGPVAEQMATGVRECCGTDWGIGITGIAGPSGGTPNKPVGLVYIGLAGPESVGHVEYRLGETRGRDWIREISVSHALNQLRLALSRNP